MEIIPGREVAQKILARLKSRPTPLKILAAVLVGKDPASISFLNQKEKAAKELSVDFRIYSLGESLPESELKEEIRRIAENDSVGGIIVQLPVPPHINREEILSVIPQGKDVDVLGKEARESFSAGGNPVLPPAVGVVQELLTTYNLQLTTKTVAVVGLGFLVGKPIAEWLRSQVKELLELDKGSDFSLLKNADLVISGVGIPGLIKPEMLKEEVNVIDFGYGVNTEGKLSGDFVPPASDGQSLTGWHTPTPGGTGPILVAKLLENFYTLSEEV